MPVPSAAHSPSLLPTQPSGECHTGSQADGLLPLGLSGMIASLPYAVWLFLAIEELPLAVDEARDPAKDIPRALSLGIVTLSITGCLTVLVNAGVAPGAAGIGLSQAPLLDGYRAVFAVASEASDEGAVGFICDGTDVKSSMRGDRAAVWEGSNLHILALRK